jgi:hypothetical protein
MEPSELFVFIWATVATILAVWFKHQARSRGIAMVALMVGFKHVAEGRAEVTIEDGQLRVREKEDATTN